ncbi:hypothetical protein FBY31_2836 [Arthrobacter sp. SLBN-100]|uniref:hypothetical protein n=1 Tax=Arthrobacter sp. SLBN-100 TaxID=2768450 RepID=UPI00114FBA3D|nr:hypothetical protein [Arthrobacter sp. SLBN-100]TQJ68724.1 hypothetical protein FBY31_2836 [Arthrobacter sp. SLBN-100]
MTAAGSRSRGRAGARPRPPPDAWAQTVAGHEWFRVEPRGGLETLDGRVFHYALTEKAPAAQIIPVKAAGS